MQAMKLLPFKIAGCFDEGGLHRLVYSLLWTVGVGLQCPVQSKFRVESVWVASSMARVLLISDGISAVETQLPCCCLSEPGYIVKGALVYRACETPGFVL